MTREPRKRSESNIYHVIARGVGRCVIFEDDADRQRFLGSLESEAKGNDVRIHAWCLMGNHYHLVLEAPIESIAVMMRRLNSSYAMYFNLRHDRIGHLFQGRFKSEPIDTEEYFLAALRYVHLNPEKAGECPASEYPWSSFREYAKGTPGIADTSFALSLLGGADGFASFHAQDDPSCECLEDTGGRRRFTDEEALAVARSVLAGSGVRVEEVAGLDRQARDEAVRRLKASRISIRQIGRITGLGRNIIARA